MFCLTSSTLEKIFADWGLDWIHQEGTFSHLLIAIRGAKLTDSPDTCGKLFSQENLFKKKVFVEPVPVDHEHMNCVLGIWKVKEQSIWMGPGSTVPHSKWVAKAVEQSGKGCNQLEPGFYTDLTKGEHLQEKPRGHMALRQTAYRMIRRTSRGIPYTKEDPLFYSNPYDNLHCAGNPNLEEAGYDSAGCLVLAGTAHRPRLPKGKQGENSGPWSFFHNAIYTDASEQTKFPLFLIEGNVLEKWYRDPDSVETLCFGSRGSAVLELQKKLKKDGLYKGKLDGVLGVRTYRLI